MTDFKVGDRVRQTDDNMPNRKGDIFIVTGEGYFPDTMRVKLERSGLDRGCWYRSRFELVPAYEVGQRFSVANKGWWGKPGVYTVDRISSGYPVFVGGAYPHGQYSDADTLSKMGLTPFVEEQASTLLDKAAELIYGDRHEAYGEYADHAELVKQQFEIILSPELAGTEIPVEKIPLLLDGLKTVRLAVNPTHTDSWVDKAGYAGCAGKLESIWAGVTE